MIELHTLDGTPVQINPIMVVSIRAPQKSKQVTHQDVQCIVNFVDGKFITVVESCAVVKQKLEEARRDKDTP